MTQVDASDVGDLFAAGRLGGPQRLNEPAHFGVVDRVDPALHQVVERADQDRHDREVAPSSQDVLEKHDLELDRVLGPMRQLVLEQVATRQRGDPIDVRRDRSERHPAASRNPCRSAQTGAGNTGGPRPEPRRCRRANAPPAPCTTRYRPGRRAGSRYAGSRCRETRSAAWAAPVLRRQAGTVCVHEELFELRPSARTVAA